MAQHLVDGAARLRNQNTSFIATALDIAVGLKQVLRRAAEIDLEALNAKTIVARAGEGAHAIRPIADEAEMLSGSIVDLASRISAQSITITRRSIAEFSENVMVGYFDRAIGLGSGAAHIDSLDPATRAAGLRLKEARAAVETEVRALVLLLDRIDHNLLAATIVTSKFRIESSLSGSAFRTNFDALVHKFEDAVSDIRAFTRGSKRALATGLGTDNV